MNKLTLKQMFQISHALGIDLFKASMSHKLKDKKLPKEFYRNRFQKEHDTVFDELVLIGYALKDKWQDLPYYYVTDTGIEAYRKQFGEIVIYKKTNERDLQYLKNRINFYCEYANYRFCEDNSTHIINTFLEYFLEGHYVSHTTKDCIMRFKNELKMHYKAGLLNKA